MEFGERVVKGEPGLIPQRKDDESRKKEMIQGPTLLVLKSEIQCIEVPKK